MRLVLDASVVVKWFEADNPEEEHVDGAMAIFDRVQRGEDDVIQPVHWCAEVMAVIARKQPGRVETAAQLLHLVDFTVADSWALYERAAALSVAYEHHLFDTLYHAVALENGAELVTADRKYYNKASELGGIVLLGRAGGRLEAGDE